VIKVSSTDAQQGTDVDLGLSVALVGDRAIVGTSFDAFYVFERDAGGSNAWGEVEKLSGDDTAPGDRFARIVAYDGEHVISGATFVDAGADHAGAAYLHAIQGSQSESCDEPSDCVSGFCVDGVCCDEVCGDDAVDDCLACSVSAGASEDGICSPVSDGSACADGTCEAGTCEVTGAGGGNGGNAGSGANGGSGANSGSGSPGNADDSDSGCSCRLAARQSSAPALPILALAMLWLVRGRTRRARRGVA